MRESEKIYFARRPPTKPTIRRVGVHSGLPWVVEAPPLEISTHTYESAIQALCRLYKYGINR